MIKTIVTLTMKMMRLALLLTIDIMRNIPQTTAVFLSLVQVFKVLRRTLFLSRNFKNFTIQARNYWLNSDEKVSDNDNFENSNKKVKDFHKTLKIPQGINNLNSLLYSMFYSIQFKKKRKM